MVSGFGRPLTTPQAGETQSELTQARLCFQAFISACGWPSCLEGNGRSGIQEQLSAFLLDLPLVSLSQPPLPVAKGGA